MSNTIVPEGYNWFELWVMDKNSIVSTMQNNLIADLEAGYDPNGKSITEQRKQIDEYIDEFGKTLDSFNTMSDRAIRKFCFLDMLKRGALSEDFYDY